MMVTTGLEFVRLRTARQSGSWLTTVEVSTRSLRSGTQSLRSTLASHPEAVQWKGGQGVYRLMVVHIHHATARTACRSCRINFGDLLLLCAHFQVVLMGRDFNAFSYRHFRTGSQQIAASLQDSSLAVHLARESTLSSGTPMRITQSTSSKSDINMAYLDEHIEEYRLKRDDIMLEGTDAAGESTKLPRLQQALQESDENFEVIGLVSFSWGHAKVKVLAVDERYVRERYIPQSKSAIIKNKYVLRYLAGQERMCKMSSMAQLITPQLLSLRSRDQDTPCAQGRASAVANIGRDDIIDRLHHQLRGH